MARWGSKVDANQKEIVKVFRQMGATVRHTHMVGQGFPDLVVGYRGRNWLIEIKDGSKMPSAKLLTPQEQEFFDTWRGSVFIIESEQQAIDLLNP